MKRKIFLICLLSLIVSPAYADKIVKPVANALSVSGKTASKTVVMSKLPKYVAGTMLAVPAQATFSQIAPYHPDHTINLTLSPLQLSGLANPEMLSGKTAVSLSQAMQEAQLPSGVDAYAPVQHVQLARELINHTISSSSLNKEEKQNLLQFYNNMFHGDKTGINPGDEDTKNFFNQADPDFTVEDLVKIQRIINASPLISESGFYRLIVRNGKLMPEIEISRMVSSEAELKEALDDALEGTIYTGDEVTLGKNEKRVRFGEHEKGLSTRVNAQPMLHVHVEQPIKLESFVGINSPLKDNVLWLNVSYKLPVDPATLDAIFKRTPSELFGTLTMAEKQDFMARLCAANVMGSSKMMGPLASSLNKYYSATNYAEQAAMLDRMYILLYKQQPPITGYSVEQEEQLLKKASGKVVEFLHNSALNGATGKKAAFYNELLGKARSKMLNMPLEDAINKVYKMLSSYHK